MNKQIRHSDKKKRQKLQKSTRPLQSGLWSAKWHDRRRNRIGLEENWKITSWSYFTRLKPNEKKYCRIQNENIHKNYNYRLLHLGKISNITFWVSVEFNTAFDAIKLKLIMEAPQECRMRGNRLPIYQTGP